MWISMVALMKKIRITEKTRSLHEPNRNLFFYMPADAAKRAGYSLIHWYRLLREHGPHIRNDCNGEIGIGARTRLTSREIHAIMDRNGRKRRKEE